MLGPPAEASTPKVISVRRVLIADDEDRQRSALEELLIDEGFEVIAVEDGFELHDYLQLAQEARGVPCPDVIVTDVRMPGETGIEVVEEARARGVRIPIVVVTGYPSPELEARVRALGNAQMFAKPIDVDHFVAALRRLITAS